MTAAATSRPTPAGPVSRTRSALVLALAAAMTVSAGATGVAADAAPAAALTFLEVAPGIHAGLQPHDRRFDDANVLVVVGDESVLVVDAPARPEAVQALIEGVRALTDLPVSHVINTHWHADHTQGNAALRAAFGDGLVIIGQATLSRDVPGRAAPSVHDRAARLREMLPRAEAALERGRGLEDQELSPEQQEQQRAAITRARDWLAGNGDARFLAPDRTYDDRMVIDLPPHRVELLHLPGHTRGDTVVWVPTARVLASGDLVDDLPYVGHGFPVLWVDSLNRLRDLPWAVMVPGHGPVFDTRRPFARVRGYIEALLQRARAARQDGRTLEDLQDQPKMERWRARFGADDDPAAARFFDGVLGEALERAWRDIHGELEAELAGD